MEKSESTDEHEKIILFNKLICFGLFLFDMLLGLSSLIAPRTVQKLFQPYAEPQGEWFLRRAATIWLFFVPVQLWAMLRADNPKALRAVAVLRLQEIGADPVWLATGEGFGKIGKFGLVFAPLFNLFVGSYLWYAAKVLEEESE